MIVTMTGAVLALLDRACRLTARLMPSLALAAAPPAPTTCSARVRRRAARPSRRRPRWRRYDGERRGTSSEAHDGGDYGVGTAEPNRRSEDVVPFADHPDVAR